MRVGNITAQCGEMLLAQNNVNPENMNAQPKPKRSTLSKILIGVGAVLVACCGLSAIGAVIAPKTTPAAAPTAVISMKLADGVTAAPASMRVPVDTVIAVPTFTPVPTQPPAPTNTSVPTDTPAPTDTPEPTEAPKEPITQTGKGSDVIAVPEDYGPAIVLLKNKGGGNFIVYALDVNGEKVDLLVNAIGTYNGIVELNFKGPPITRLSIQSDGVWGAAIAPLSSAHRADVPGTISGDGDDVFVLNGSPDLLKMKSSGKGNFVVYGYRRDGQIDLLVNEIGAYEGTVPLPRDTALIVVKADGPWTFEITAP